MNIFYLAPTPREAAQLHCDKHVVKMILETAQILATVHHTHGNHEVTYKATHVNHPSVKWAAATRANYLWLHKLGLELCAEYYYRYGKIHKCHQYLIGELYFPPTDQPDGEWSEPPACMPDEYKTDDIVQSYKNYYRGAKSQFAKWTNRDTPDFMTA